MRKTIWALPLAAVLVAATGVPSASAASGLDTRPVQYDAATDSQVTTETDMHIGDCSMTASVSIGRPRGGIARFRFSFVTSTSHTNNFDQWHNSWRFLRANGTEVKRLGPIDGLHMGAGRPYSGEIDQDIHLTEAAWSVISQAVWTHSC